ncbi:MAG: glycosyltransferase family 39 protein [Ktedonobacteraceae bacterium]|nr:glycosyltransferase family 39 protein [Ktedonobacteraceae bacterium]
MNWAPTDVDLTEFGVVLVLALAACIPRFLLALRLDVVTDEVVYILGAKLYFPLLLHLRIGAGGWSYNYEHPPFVKLLIGLALTCNAALGHPLPELVAARMPSILCGTLLVVALYWLGRDLFGRVVSLLAALCLAFSPWLVYFSALAYLDMTMTALITIAFLLMWHAIRKPWLYLLAALLVGLAADSKYTAVLAIPGMILFTAYYFFLLRPRLPVEQPPRLPWLWWLTAIIASPAIFLAADPAIWPHPISLLVHSFRYEWDHSRSGHLTFIAGQYSLHVPHWATLYIVFVKMSAFITIPAAFFVLFALTQLLRFHLGATNMQTREVASLSFLLIWLVSIVSTFSLLNIVVGTHYELPIAPPLALAGVSGLAMLLRYRKGSLFASTRARPTAVLAAQTRQTMQQSGGLSINLRTAIIVACLALLVVGPHLLGLSTVYAAEGYNSEFFHGENTALQVAYPGYREAVQWIVAHTHGQERVGLGAIAGTLSGGSNGVSWLSYNSHLAGRLTLIEAHPNDHGYPYDYLVWPMHLVQRGFAIPVPWRWHIVHIVMGGNTVYSYIAVRSPDTITS